MKYSDIKSLTFLGIGGKGAFYIAKYFSLLNKEVFGYDLKETENTEILENMGVEIRYRNPKEGEFLRGDLIVYSNDLPQKLQQRIFESNPDTEFIEVGHLYKLLTEAYENDDMDPMESAAFISSEIAPLYDLDLENMKYIGVTGTDGKTSTCTMIYNILIKNGYKPGLITTVSAKIGDEEVDTGFHTTTPTSQELYKLIKKAEEANCTHIIIESTSHGLEQGRLAGIKFDAVAFTNITSEHMDYHRTWENYATAKSLIITKHLKEDGVVILNADDKSYDFLKDLNADHLSYSIKSPTDLYAKDISEKEDGLRFEICHGEDCIDVFMPILGKYNISNFLAAAGVSINLGLPLEQISETVKDFVTVKGRMEILQRKPFWVIVDYAHTPNAIKEALESARNLLGDTGRIIHVFGSAGHRDFYKRPMMGAMSNEYADITILTAEDSRLESLEEINDSIEKGWRDNGKEGELIRFDYTDKDVEVRRDAIKKALEIALPGDMVIITGKAHETSLCFGQTEYPWNDIEETKTLL